MRKKTVLLLIAHPNGELRFVSLLLNETPTPQPQAERKLNQPTPNTATGPVNDQCPESIEIRRKEIAKIAAANSRDYENGTLVLEFLQCGSLEGAMDTVSRMIIAQERDGAYTKIMMKALTEKKHDVASQALEKILVFQTKEQLRTVLVAEIGRKQGDGWDIYDPNDPDNVTLSYGSLGGVVYNYRTGVIQEWSPCGRGRGYCSTLTPGAYYDDKDLGAYGPDYSQPIEYPPK